MKNKERDSFIHRYVLPRREYKVKALTENRQDFVVEETYWIFGTSVWHTYHVENSFLGTPYIDYSAAKTVKEQLEKTEKKAALDREINFIWISVAILLTAVFLGTFKYL